MGLLENLHDLGWRVIALNLLRRKRVQERTSDCVLYRGQLHLLEALIQSPGCTQNDIASRLCVTPASVAQSVKRLQCAGLIERRVDETNLRRNKLYATPAGIAAAARYRDCFDGVDRETFANFSDDELQSLRQYLDRMIENVRGDDFDIYNFPGCLPARKETRT